MAKFDVHELGSKSTPLVVAVQSDLIEEIATRVVIPLSRVDAAPHTPASRLNPVILISGQAHIVMTPNIASVPKARLGPVIANVEADHGDTITGALDFLFYGFSGPVTASG